MSAWRCEARIVASGEVVVDVVIIDGISEGTKPGDPSTEHFTEVGTLRFKRLSDYSEFKELFGGHARVTWRES